MFSHIYIYVFWIIEMYGQYFRTYKSFVKIQGVVAEKIENRVMEAADYVQFENRA